MPEQHYGSIEDGQKEAKKCDAQAHYHTEEFLVNVHTAKDAMSGGMKGGDTKDSVPPSEVIAGGIVTPILVFILVTWIKSAEIRYHASQFSCFLALIIIVLIFCSCGLPASRMDMTPKRQRLYYYITFCALNAWVMGLIAGNMNYQRYFKSYFDLTSLVIKYPNVNTATYHGQQFLDAAVMEFQKGTYVDANAGFGFKNGDTYCVAPIVSPLAKMHGFQNFDFWAVGVNCCSNQGAKFACGEYNNPKASKGLRLLNDDLRNYFRLAVEGACAANSITAKYPIFFYWMEHPEQEVEAMIEQGWGYMGRETLAFMVMQVCLTLVMGLRFNTSKTREPAED